MNIPYRLLRWQAFGPSLVEDCSTDRTERGHQSSGQGPVARAFITSKALPCEHDASTYQGEATKSTRVTRASSHIFPQTIGRFPGFPRYHRAPFYTVCPKTISAWFGEALETSKPGRWARCGPGRLIVWAPLGAFLLSRRGDPGDPGVTQGDLTMTSKGCPLPLTH